MDAMNAFLHCDLDETVFVRMTPGFEKKGRVLRLRKALYGLKRSPLLWQKKLAGAFRELGFREIPQELVLCYRKKEHVTVEAIKNDLKTLRAQLFRGIKVVIGHSCPP
jgi:hypothetical protein